MRIVRPGTRIVDRRLAVGAVGSRSGRDRARCARRGSDHRPGRAAGRAFSPRPTYRWVRRTTRRRETGRDDRRRHCAADDQPHPVRERARHGRPPGSRCGRRRRVELLRARLHEYRHRCRELPGSGAAEAFSTIQATARQCTTYSGTDGEGVGVDYRVEPLATPAVGDASTGIRLITTSDGFSLVSDAMLTVVDSTVVQVVGRDPSRSTPGFSRGLARSSAERIHAAAPTR